MDALRFIGFVLVVVLAVAGVDYYQQDKKHEGTLSANGYVDTLKQRFALYHEELDAEKVERERQKRWRAGGKHFLPDSDKEWVRRAIADRDFARDAREGVLQDNISEAARPLAKKVAIQKAQQLASKVDRNSWVYEKGEHTIWVQISLRKDARSNTLAGNIAQSVDALGISASDYTPFGVIGGVAFFQFTQNKYSVIRVDDRAFWSMVTAGITDLSAPVAFNVYKGTIGLGEEIRLKMYSDAPAQDVHAFLSRLDYDGLNALLSQPVPGVGNDAVVNAETETELAVNMAELRSEFMKLRGELAQLRLNNVDGLALVANTMAAQYGLPDDTFDLTANKIQSADDLVQLGYRRGLTDLLAGETQKAGSEGGNMFGRFFASFKGDPKQPTAEDGGAGGFFGGLKSYFQKDETAQAPTVRVNKGGAGVSSKCATKEAFKTCTLGDG